MSPSQPAGPPSACNSQRLQQFLASDHFRIEADELIAHLDQCPACQQELEAQAGDAQVWNHATNLLKPREFDTAGSALFSAAGTICHPQPHANPMQDVLDGLAPTDDPLSLGRIGTYEVTGVVGVGGMGVVLKAIDPSLDRVVAIKLMAPRLAHHDAARKRFAREAKAAAAIMHPNVIPIHSVSSEGPAPYLVMAFNRGGSLQKRLEREAPLPLVEVLRIGSQIAAGLAAAHEQGLVHRDIKPENILLEEGVERVTITDFGLARAVDDNTITHTGTISGTPMYMSPEQARGDHVDQQSDLFSLGSVLYALCTGQPPYQGDSSYSVMRKIIDESPTPLRNLNSAIPDWTARIIEKLMDKDKAHRFASASEVHKLLEACLSHVQQPHGTLLPAIPSSIRPSQPPTVSGVRRMLKFIAGMATMALIAFAVLQGRGTPHPVPTASSDSSSEIRRDTEFDIPELTVDLAERLIGRSEHVTFSRVTALSPEVATVLTDHPGNLNFPAIKQLTPEVAAAFARKKKQFWIVLRGLNEISLEVAQQLSQATCALDLGGFDAVTPDVAAELSRTPGTLSLGIKSLTPEVAEKLAMHQGWLSLNSLTTIDPESTIRLAKHDNWLTLNGLSALTPQVANAFGDYHGDKLELSGLQSLDLETAKQLSRAHCQSGLYFNGLKSVTPDVIQELANGNSHLSFQGLAEIDSQSRQALEAARKTLAAVGKILLVPATIPSVPDAATNAGTNPDAPR